MKKENAKRGKVVLGVTGSIAAYKALEIVRKVQDAGYEVEVIMTGAACEFVSPLSFQTLSQKPVKRDLFPSPRGEEWEMEHLSLAESADLFLVAPATANIIGKLAGGIADDLLSTAILATRAPVLLAPAMSENMYSNRVVRENIARLKKLKFRFIGPVKGSLASGKKGEGRLAGIEEIVGEVEKILNPRTGTLKGKTFLITAGPTREPLDPLRYLSNSSSGRMGYALASLSYARGAEVILVSGPTSLLPPEGVKTVGVRTALEMKKAVERFFKKADVVIKSAAVVDYRIKKRAEKKIKSPKGLKIELVRNPDILKGLGRRKGRKILVGFALETENLIARAKDKLKKKNLDLIVANGPDALDSGISKASIITREGKTIDLPRLPKEEIAAKIVDCIETELVR